MWLTKCSWFVIALVMVIGIPANLIILAGFVKNKRTRNSTNIFMVSMAVGNLISLILSAGAYTVTGVTQKHYFICTVTAFVNESNMTMVQITLVMVSINRLTLVTCQRKSYQKFFSKRKTVILLLLSWMIIATVHGVKTLKHKKTSTILSCYIVKPMETERSNNGFPWQRAFIWSTLYMFIPALITGLAYGRVAIFLHRRRLLQTGQAARRQQRQVSITMALVFLGHFLCVLPIGINPIVAYFSPVPLALRYVAAWMFLFMQALNPVIFVGRSREFWICRKICPKCFKNSVTPS